MSSTESSSSDSESESETPKFIFDTTPSSGPAKPLDTEKKSMETTVKSSKINKGFKLASAMESGIDATDSYLSIFPEKKSSDIKNKLKVLSMKSTGDEILKNSVVCQPGFEKQFTVPPYLEGKKKIRRDRLIERDKTKGNRWFNLPATELTEERKNDLMVMQMRNALDPKRFYKKNTDKTLPKYFQIGTIVEAPIDFYHSRIPKKQRKQTLVDELLADVEFRQYQKRKVAEVMKNQPQKVYHSKKRKTKLLESRNSNTKTKKTKKIRK